MVDWKITGKVANCYFGIYTGVDNTAVICIIGRLEIHLEVGKLYLLFITD